MLLLPWSCALLLWFCWMCSWFLQGVSRCVTLTCTACCSGEEGFFCVCWWGKGGCAPSFNSYYPLALAWLVLFQFVCTVWLLSAFHQLQPRGWFLCFANHNGFANKLWVFHYSLRECFVPTPHVSQMAWLIGIFPKFGSFANSVFTFSYNAVFELDTWHRHFKEGKEIFYQVLQLM